jgi:predicted RNase H-like HicB family nuclease
MTLYSYPITVEREGKRYYAYSEDFPGVYGLGKSIDEARMSILEAMRLYIQQCRKKGKPARPRSSHRLRRDCHAGPGLNGSRS